MLFRLMANGKWQIKEVELKKSKLGLYSWNRFHIYHPDSKESKQSIQVALDKMKKKFSGKRKITADAMGGSEMTAFHYVNFVRLGKKLPSAKEAAELTKKQARLKALRVEAKGLLKLISAELAKVGKKLALNPKTKRKKPIGFK